MDWPMVRLSEVVAIDRNSVTPENISAGTRYVGLENINSDGELHDFQIVDDGELRSNKFQFDSRHILYGKLRPYLRKISRPDFSGICSTDILPIRCGPKMDKNFVYHYLRKQEMVDMATSRCSGANLPRLSPKILLTFQIPKPPLEEQKRIAAILDRADEIKLVSDQTQSVRDKFQSSVFLEFFGDSTIEEKYSRTTIDKNSLTISKGTTPMTHGMDFVSEGIPFLRVQDLVKNPIDPFFAIKAIDQATHDFLSRSQLKPNDILVSIAGTIGRVSIVSKGSPEMNCNQAVAFVRLAETSVLRHCYLMHWLNSRDARLQMAGSSVTATISNLSLGKIKELKVPVPPLDLQLQFEKICERFGTISTHNGQINDLVNSITQEMFA